MVDWRRTKKGNMIVNAPSNHSDTERVNSDFYATDPKAIDFLLKYESFDENVWECACGDGALSKRLEDYGYNVLSTDIVDRGYRGERERAIYGIDFLTQTKKFNGDIITNPPYKYSTEFVLKALELSKRKVAMFLKIQFLESQGRWDKIFSKYPPSVVYVFVKRIKCYPNGIDDGKSSAVCYCWFIFDKEYDGEPRIRWINNK